MASAAADSSKSLDSKSVDPILGSRLTDDAVDTYLAAINKMRSVAQRKEVSATIQDVSPDMFHELQDTDDWDKLR